MLWFYVKNCICVRMTDKFFSGDRSPFARPLPPKVEVLEPAVDTGQTATPGWLTMTFDSICRIAQQRRDGLHEI